MCGIAGWVDFDRNLELAPNRELAHAMAETMACRGPDDEGLWTAPHAALGHRRLAVIDIEGGQQPISVEQDGQAIAVMTYSGEVYNFRELRVELAARGHCFRTRSDTEVVLRAYVEWGQEFVHRLNGMYALAIWDLRSDTLLLVRDRMGIKPLYYYPCGRGLLFASEPKAILAHPLADRTVDAAGLRELFSGVKAPGVSVFRGMYELRPGSVLRLSRNGWNERRYWALEARDHNDDLQATIRTVRDLLDDIVARQLVSDVPLCTLLSGGLDSSILTALAAKALRGNGGGRVRSFAVDFVDYVKNFTPDVVHPTPDAPYVHDVAHRVDSDHTDITLSSDEMARVDVRRAVVRALDWPTHIGSMDISLYLLFGAIRERSTVALTGESADELFGGYPWFHHPEYVEPGTLPWTLAHNLGIPTLFGPLLAELHVRAYQTDQYRQAIEQAPRLPGERGHARRMREFSHFFLTRFLRVLLDRKDRLSMAHGLEVRVPYCDHRLMEYVFNVPWEMKVYDGHEKSLLRGAVCELLPRSVLERPKTGYPVAQDPAYDRAIRAEFSELLATQESAVQPLLNPEIVRAVRDDPEMATMLTRTEVDLALQLNDWLELGDLRLAC